MSDDVSVYGIRGQVGGPAAAGPNPLVSGPVETTTPFTGLRLVEDCEQLSAAIQNKDWLSGSLAGVATVADTVAMVTNPIGEVAAMGVGWLLEHVSPLSDWFKELTGDAGAVAGAASTWNNVATQLGQVKDQYLSDLVSTLGHTSSQTSTAYRALARDLADHLEAAAGLAHAVSTGLTIASTIVQIVHDLVREAIGDVVALAVGSLIPTPKIIWDVATKVAKWVSLLGSKIRGVVDSARKFGDLLRQSDGLLGRLRDAFSKIRLMSAAVPLPSLARRTPESIDDLIKKPVISLTPQEAARVLAARNAIAAPPGTPMQRVVPNSSVDPMLDGTSPYGVDTTHGFTARESDTSHLTTPQQLYDGLALSYPGSPYLNADGSVVDDMHLVRYPQPDAPAAVVPRHSVLGGDGWDAQAVDPTNPFTGNGFTAGGVPEFHTGTPVTMAEGSQIWRTDASGTPTLVATLSTTPEGTPVWIPAH